VRSVLEATVMVSRAGQRGGMGGASLMLGSLWGTSSGGGGRLLVVEPGLLLKLRLSFSSGFLSFAVPDCRRPFLLEDGDETCFFLPRVPKKLRCWWSDDRDVRVEMLSWLLAVSSRFFFSFRSVSFLARRSPTRSQS